MNAAARSILIVVAGLAFTAVTAAGLFLIAGRWDLPMFWAALIVMAVLSVTGSLACDPGLLRERLKPGPGGLDRSTIALGQLLVVGGLILAGLDVGRFRWSASIPIPLQILGLVVFGLGLALAVWAMVVNRFFSPLVRLQTERGHLLIQAGPYRWVRHPGYAGGALGLPWLGVALGSWLSVLPLLAFSLLLLRRTKLEDRFLRARLAGYPEYAERVRWRLVPGVW